MSKERATPVDRRLVAMQERIEELERELFNTEADRQLQLELKTTYMRELNELERESDDTIDAERYRSLRKIACLGYLEAEVAMGCLDHYHDEQKIDEKVDSIIADAKKSRWWK